jgi:ribosome biogenesis protein NSA1
MLGQVAAAYADGSVCAFRLQPDDTLKEVEKWTEPRLKAGARYVGISATERCVFND